MILFFLTQSCLLLVFPKVFFKVLGQTSYYILQGAPFTAFPYQPLSPAAPSSALSRALSSSCSNQQTLL